MARPLSTLTPATRRPPRQRPAGGLVEAAYLAGTLLTTALGATFVLRLWNADLRVPFYYRFDAFFDGLLTKGILEHGWYLHNPSLGAPFGLSFYDFPLGGDNLQLLIIKTLGMFSRDWVVVTNAYFLLSFAMIATTSYVVVRQIGLSRGLSLAVATLFSFLPYHFNVGELLVSTYFAVPLGGFLVLDALGWDVWGPPFLARAETDRSGSCAVRWAVRAALAALIASSGSYYAPFTMLLVAVAGGLALLSGGGRRVAGRAGVVVAMIGVVFVMNLAPTLLYRQAHGTNAQVSVRDPGESDVYGLHIVDMFLPAIGHRVPALAGLKDTLDSWYPTSPLFPSPFLPLGAIGASGLALSLVAALSVAVRPDRAGSQPRLRLRLARLGALNLSAIILAAATGLSAALSLAGVTQIRVWSRMVIFIGFFSLVAIGLAAQDVGPRLRSFLERRGASRGGARGAMVVAIAAFVVVGMLDQTQARLTPRHDYNRTLYSSESRFVAEIEQRLPRDSAVFQLPLASFPERPVIVHMVDYQLARGYLHSTHLRWSYPAMRGRPTDWARSIGGRPVDVMLDDVTAAGFSGLYVDRAGFVDMASGLEQEMARLIGPPAAVSAEAQLLFWDLRPWAARQLATIGPEGAAARAALVLHPVVPAWKEGFQKAQTTPPSAGSGDLRYFPAVPGQQVVTGYWAQSPAVMELTNPLVSPRPVRLTLEAKSASGATGPLTFSSPGMADVTVPVAAGPTPVEVALTLPPGTSAVRVTSPLPATTTAVDTTAAFWIQNVTIVDVDDHPTPPPLPR